MVANMYTSRVCNKFIFYDSFFVEREKNNKFSFFLNLFILFYVFTIVTFDFCVAGLFPLVRLLMRENFFLKASIVFLNLPYVDPLIPLLFT